MKQEGFIEIIQQATEMLLDRSEPERDLIYHICMMEDDLRSAIILAYRNIKGDFDERT